MPIISYLAYPRKGCKQELAAALTALPECEIIPAENQELLVLVTETTDKQAAEDLQDTLKDIASLECLAMVAGYDDHELVPDDEGAKR